jgi:hypothetical protein
MYCNPLPLEHYQRGRAHTVLGHRGGRDYRSMADPTVIHFKGSWYLFPSDGMLWHSDDMVNWKHHPIKPFDPGWAPTVVVKGDWLYMTASWDSSPEPSALWRARHPFGPWEKMGAAGQDADGNPTWLKDHEGNPVRWGDPCLFVDDDGAMYCYCNLERPAVPADNLPWKLAGVGGICGVRLRDDDPSRFAAKPEVLIDNVSEASFRRWERDGACNQKNHRNLEGPWMNKIGGRYFLQYSGNGTQFRNYAIGCFVSDKPLGPFVRQQRNPILIHKGGLVNGCAHHSIVEGPGGTLWCFYTTLVGIERGDNRPGVVAGRVLERRIGMDPAGLDENGELFVAGPTETPQHAPGVVADPLSGNDLGLVPLSVDSPVGASSWVEGREPMYAVDNFIRTWWQAADARSPQWLEVDLEGEFVVNSARTMFADRGLDYAAGVVPGPYRYRVLGSLDGKEWFVLADQSANRIERHIVLDTWEPRLVRRARLEVLAAPPGMEIAVWEFTVFGWPQGDEPPVAAER